MKRRSMFLLVFACAVLLSSNISAKMTLKLGHVAPPSHGQHAGLLAFAEHVKQKTNGEIQIDVFPSGQLGGERSMVEQVQTGVLDMVASTTGVISNFVPEIALFDLSFLWPSREVAYQVMDDPEFQKIFFSLFPKRKLVVLGYAENDMRDITNTKKEIRKPEDLKGIKIRVMESPIYLDAFKQLGASPIPMPFPEVYQALQTGVIDAQDNPIMTSVQMKFNEVCPYATLTNHILSEVLVLISSGLWDKLDATQQQIFRDAAKVGIRVNREECAKLREKLTKEAEEKGMKIVRLSPEEKKFFVQALKPVHKKYEKQAGKIPNDKMYGQYAGKSYYQMIQDKIIQYQ